tara:strand:- start:533 stop:787 length:255 start_codon:yes stop_codon:yes gene_type:complete
MGLNVLDKVVCLVMGDCDKKGEAFKNSPADTTAALVVVVVVFLLILLFAKYLWNNFACKFVTVLKPVRNVVDILALMVIFAMMS